MKEEPPVYKPTFLWHEHPGELPDVGLAPDFVDDFMTLASIEDVAEQQMFLEEHFASTGLINYILAHPLAALTGDRILGDGPQIMACYPGRRDGTPQERAAFRVMHALEKFGALVRNDNGKLVGAKNHGVFSMHGNHMANYGELGPDADADVAYRLGLMGMNNIFICGGKPPLYTNVSNAGLLDLDVRHIPRDLFLTILPLTLAALVGGDEAERERILSTRGIDDKDLPYVWTRRRFMDEVSGIHRIYKPLAQDCLSGLLDSYESFLKLVASDNVESDSAEILVAKARVMRAMLGAILPPPTNDEERDISIKSLNYYRTHEIDYPIYGDMQTEADIALNAFRLKMILEVFEKVPWSEPMSRLPADLPPAALAAFGVHPKYADRLSKLYWGCRDNYSLPIGAGRVVGSDAERCLAFGMILVKQRPEDFCISDGRLRFGSDTRDQQEQEELRKLLELELGVSLGRQAG